MSLNKILSTLCTLIVCLTLVLANPIPVPENVLPQQVNLEATALESNPNAIRIARHLFRHRHHGGGGCGRCGGYGGGYQGGSGSFAGAAAGSNSNGGNSNSQAQAASFNFGPFSASFASSFSGSQGGGYFDY